ncbi:LOW QUALITY PROTEIN: transmembrane protein 180-like [Dugong dugon]
MGFSARVHRPTTQRPAPQRERGPRPAPQAGSSGSSRSQRGTLAEPSPTGDAIQTPGGASANRKLTAGRAAANSSNRVSPTAGGSTGLKRKQPMTPSEETKKAGKREGVRPKRPAPHCGLYRFWESFGRLRSMGGCACVGVRPASQSVDSAAEWFDHADAGKYKGRSGVCGRRRYHLSVSYFLLDVCALIPTPLGILLAPRKKSSSAWKMKLLSIKPIAWACFMITLETEMLNSIFRFYYVKLFFYYRISEVTFYQAQIILMIWNALNDLTGYFHSNSKAECCSSCCVSVLYGAPLRAVAFLLPWLPWKYYHEGAWLSGLHLMVLSCAFDGMLSFVRQTQCALFAEVFTRHESWLQLIKINQVASLVRSTSILFCGLIFDNMEILHNFQVVAVVVAILAAASIYAAVYSRSHFEPKRSPEENLHSERGQDVSWTSIISLHILTQKNFWLFLIMSFFQDFHLTFLNNFMMIFADNLIPADVVFSSTRSIMYRAGLVRPPLSAPGLPSSLASAQLKPSVRKLFSSTNKCPKAPRSARMLPAQRRLVLLLCGSTCPLMILQASSCLFNLLLADMVDADLLKFSRRLPLSSMVFGINALLTKPARPLAPMVIISKLT